MNDSLAVDTSYNLAVQTDSLVSKLTDMQGQICLLNEAHVMAQKQYYLFCGMAVIALLLVIFLFRRRLSVVKQEQYRIREDILRKIETLTERINGFEQVISKRATDKQCILEATPMTHNTASVLLPAKTVFTPESGTCKPVASVGGLRIKYGSIQAPDSEGVLRIADRSLSDTSSTSKWFVISYQEDSSMGTYIINTDAMGEILQDLQTFQLFVEPFTQTNSTPPTHVAVVRNGILLRVERGWVVKKRLVVKF